MRATFAVPRDPGRAWVWSSPTGGCADASSSSRRRVASSAAAARRARRVTLVPRRVAPSSGSTRDDDPGRGATARLCAVPTAREGSDGSDPTASPASRGSVGERRESASDPASDPAFHFVALGDDPLGKAALGRAGQRWLEAASLEAAREFVAEVRAAGSDPDAWFAIHGADEHATNPIRRLAPHAAIRDPPSDRASACAAAATHEPTVTSFLNRAARRAVKETDAKAAVVVVSERADLASDPAWIVLRRITARRRRAAKRRRTKHAVAGGKIAEGGGREGGGREGGGREEGGGRKEGGGRGSRRERPLDDDEGWRSASKSSLRDAVSRFADVASALLMSERETGGVRRCASASRGRVRRRDRVRGNVLGPLGRGDGRFTIDELDARRWEIRSAPQPPVSSTSASTTTRRASLLPP